MGMKHIEISLKMPTDYREEELRQGLETRLGTASFTYRIESKSLDARKKNNIHWLIRAAVLSEEINGDEPIALPQLTIPYGKRTEQAVVVGSGPAGFFAALVLQEAGFNTTIVERGSKVGQRAKGIRAFEQTGLFDPLGNYAFGEGGAGTFSDGKLTSRSKHISKEKRFILSRYIKAGAPEEIWYMAHPHLGSDNLKKIVRNLRDEFLSIGGTVLFETFLEDLTIKDNRVTEAKTDSGTIQGDYFIIAPGHSAYETYRMLMRRGVQFRTKNFALGCRVEHPQELVNLAQWGRVALPGVKAAEYRLTSKGDGNLPVYTFCMCPGGIIVPAAAYPDKNLVNGMSQYNRDGRFANAACVAGLNLEKLLGRAAEPQEALDWLENLEDAFHGYAKGFRAPFCGIRDFIEARETSDIVETSYPLGLVPAALWELLPSQISNALREGLQDFNRKMKGFSTGIIMGLESKTSAPIRVLRGDRHLCQGFENLYLAGEGSGHSGGIISSGADGIKCAMQIVEAN